MLNITYPTENAEYFFKNLKAGDMFMAVDNPSDAVYIKTSTQDYESVYNAVNLKNGLLCTINDTANVYKMKGDLFLEYDH